MFTRNHVTVSVFLVKFLVAVCVAKSESEEELSQIATLPLTLSPANSLVWGPGLEVKFVVPARYFYIQAVDKYNQKYVF